jgi:hypothetical protein
MSQATVHKIAILRWQPNDGVTQMIAEALTTLGHQPIYFTPGTPLAEDVTLVITHVHGPPRHLLPVLAQIAQHRATPRPLIVHWNTEGYPDLRLPPRLMWLLSSYRSRLGRLCHPDPGLYRQWATRPLITGLEARMTRFRNMGDYDYAYRQGWLDILADSSQIYAQINQWRGIPTFYLPWGPTASIYADRKLTRDIDVLWMGKRATRRRSQLLDQLRHELRAYGVNVYVADNEENPFIFGETRINFLNRAKITLNLTRTWYDDNFSRFAYAAPNRSLLVSEPLLPHCPEFKPGLHYVAAPIDQLAQTIVYYLTHTEARQAIAENAFELVINQLAFQQTFARLLEAAEVCRKARSSSHAGDNRSTQTPAKSVKAFSA